MKTPLVSTEPIKIELFCFEDIIASLLGILACILSRVLIDYFTSSYLVNQLLQMFLSSLNKL